MDTISVIGITLIAIYVILWLYNIWATHHLFHTPMNEGGLADENGELFGGFGQPSIFVLMFMALWLPHTAMWIHGIWWSLFSPQLPKFRNVPPVTHLPIASPDDDGPF